MKKSRPNSLYTDWRMLKARMMGFMNGLIFNYLIHIKGQLIINSH